MRGICRQKKVGHTGTLDPDATGVLPVCLGSGTKLCDMLAERDKEYVAELLLGVTTDTQDVSGTVLSEHPVDADEAQVREVILSFLGPYDQIPPMYSALKVNGKKLYELAREGKEVERKARRVEILELEILSIELPVVKMRVACTKGTYIRTLCADIGEKLGCGGTMKSLQRTRVGRYVLAQALTLGELQALRDADDASRPKLQALRDADDASRLKSVLIPTESAFYDCRRLLVKPEADRLLRNGNAIRPADILREDDGAAGAVGLAMAGMDGEDGQATLGTDNAVKQAVTQRVRMCASDGTFLGLYEFASATGRYEPVKMFFS